MTMRQPNGFADENRDESVTPVAWLLQFRGMIAV
jgi:hypothetical protein